MSVKLAMTDDAMLEMRASEGAKTRKRPLVSPAWRVQASQRVTQRILLFVPPLVLGALIVSSWFLATSYAHVSSLILPAPGDVFASLREGLGSGLFLSSALTTVQESILGFLLAVGIALPLGFGIAKFRLFAATVQPYLAAGQAIPAIVIAPVLFLIFGYGTVTITLLCMLIVLFPMVITTALGFQTIDSALTDAARVEGASGWSLFAHIEFPLALPAILAALRTGLTLSITGALVGEFVMQGTQGLGSLVLVSTAQFNESLLFATLMVLASLAALYYGASWGLVKLAEAIY